MRGLQEHVFCTSSFVVCSRGSEPLTGARLCALYLHQFPDPALHVVMATKRFVFRARHVRGSTSALPSVRAPYCWC